MHYSQISQLSSITIIKMDVQQLNELSYKELQGKAKQFSIPANQKKDILIAEIVALGEGYENNENAPAQANRSIAVPVTPSAKPMRVTRSTVKKGLVHRDEVEIESLTEQVESLKVEPVAEVAKVSPVKAISAPIDTIVESPLAVEESVSYDAALPTPCEDAVESTLEEEDAEDVEFPTPTKLFENNEPFEYNAQGQKIAINRHVYFMSPDAKGNVATEAEQGQTHLHFASPELQMGKGVHWRYEDYNTAEAPEETAAEEEQDEQSVVSESSEIHTQPTRMKLPSDHNDKVMSFWLTKAFANPIGNFFSK